LRAFSEASKRFARKAESRAFITRYPNTLRE
jgi:hypothetical protein